MILVDKLKDDFETLKLINKYDITYNNLTKAVKINKKIKVQDLRIFRAILIMNHVDYKDILVEV